VLTIFAFPKHGQQALIKQGAEQEILEALSNAMLPVGEK